MSKLDAMREELDEVRAAAHLISKIKAVAEAQLDAMTKERDEAIEMMQHNAVTAAKLEDELEAAEARVAELVELDEQSKSLLAAERELVEKQDKRIAELEAMVDADTEEMASTLQFAQQRVEAAEARIKVLAEALKPFADEAKRYDPPEDDDDTMAWDSRFTLGDLRRAALVEGEQK